MDFSSKECIRFGWEAFKSRPWFYIGACLLVMLAYLVAGLVTGGIDYAVTGDLEKQSLPGGLVSFVFSTLVSMGRRHSIWMLMIIRRPLATPRFGIRSRSGAF